MSEKVYQAFLRVRDKRKRVMPVIVEGYTDFLFLKSDGCPKTAHNYTVIFHQLAEKYNKCHEMPFAQEVFGSRPEAHLLHRLSQCGDQSKSPAIYPWGTQTLP